MSKKTPRLQRVKLTFDDELAARIRCLANRSDRTFQQEVCWLINQEARRMAFEEQLAGWHLIHVQTSSVPAPLDNVVSFRPRPA